MGKLAKVLAVILLLLVVAGAVFVFGFQGIDQIKIGMLLQDFQTACQDKDEEAILACLDPALAEPLDSASQLVGSFSDWLDSISGVNLESILSTVAGHIFEGGAIEGFSEEALASMDAKLHRITVSGNTGLVKTSISYADGGETILNDYTITCTKIDDKWYISKFSKD